MSSTPSDKLSSGFDKLARAYRWMEYLSFGPLLQRCRVQFLLEISDARRALVLGDGDGRFTASLLRAAPGICVHAVDESAAMLAALWQRAIDIGAADRLEMTCADATEDLPEGHFDLVCTHFFLDCFSQADMEALVARVQEHVPQGRWVISEFAVPGGAMRWPAFLLVRSLYFVFGLLTGLTTRELPVYAPVLRANGFVLMQSRQRLGGLLRAELWQRASPPLCQAIRQ